MILRRHRLVLLAACAGLAACTAEPRYPIEPGGTAGSGGFGVTPPRYPVSPPAAAPTPPPPPPPADDDAPRAAPSHSVDSSPLPPPSGAAPQRYASAETRTDRRARETEGRTEEVQRLRSQPTGPVQVQPFEGLPDVAERAHTPARALAELNGLRAPYAVQAGAVLKAPTPSSYVIAEGDTLYGVGRRFGVDPRTLATLNGITFETRLRPGEKLVLPGRSDDRGEQAGAKGRYQEARTPPEPQDGGRMAERGAPPPAAERVRPPPAPPAEAPPVATAQGEAEVAVLARGRFAWPLKGEVISSFGPKGPGQRNDGVNIAAPAGQSVRAAAAGVVVYAGNSIPAFGNLVLVKHPGGWATLYGNLGKITVSANAEVAQGQEIGTVGMTGAVDRPQVHFEIRYAQDTHEKAKPYDPAVLIPGAT